MKLKSFLFIIISTCLCSISAQAQFNTTVTIRNINNQSLRNNIESTLTNLISEFNAAFTNKRVPSLKGLNINNETKKNILSLWETSPFRCEEADIIEKANKIYGTQEYEVRNLPFVFSNKDPDDQFKQIAATFNNVGTMTSFHMTIDQNLYKLIIGNNDNVNELRKRKMITDYLEQYRNAYEIHDLKFIEQVFSDDALIITGRVIKQKPTSDNGFKSTQVDRVKQNKRQYIAKLKRYFDRGSRIRVTFDDIQISYHPTLKDWYYIKLVQGWTNGAYHDDGYLYLIWDFTDPDQPQIHVRAWDELDTPEEDLFSFESVNISN